MFTLTVVPHAGTWIEIVPKVDTKNVKSVVPHAGTWIEIVIHLPLCCFKEVVPHAGTWIEIRNLRNHLNTFESFPTRERGLK